jgi:hypothetical protein
MNYESSTLVESKVRPGISFVVARMSFGRRVDLMRRIRELLQKHEFLAAGETPQEKLEAALLTAEIDRLYIAWGLREIAGLELDGAAATPERLTSDGPEDLFQEALAAVKAECGLSESERKN